MLRCLRMSRLYRLESGQLRHTWIAKRVTLSVSKDVAIVPIRIGATQTYLDSGAKKMLRCLGLPDNVSICRGDFEAEIGGFKIVLVTFQNPCHFLSNLKSKVAPMFDGVCPFQVLKKCRSERCDFFTCHFVIFFFKVMCKKKKREGYLSKKTFFYKSSPKFLTK
jgi:hypothetical protein